MLSLLKDTSNTCSRCLSISVRAIVTTERTHPPRDSHHTLFSESSSASLFFFCLVRNSWVTWASVSPSSIGPRLHFHSHTVQHGIASWRKISLFFQNHRHAKSFSDVLKIEPGFLLLLLYGALVRLAHKSYLGKNKEGLSNPTPNIKTPKGSKKQYFYYVKNGINWAFGNYKRGALVIMIWEL